MTATNPRLCDLWKLTGIAKDDNLKIWYCRGRNNAGTNEDELLMVAGTGPDAPIAVVLSGISRLKAEAIAMILNAPEGES